MPMVNAQAIGDVRKRRQVGIKRQGPECHGHAKQYRQVQVGQKNPPKKIES